MNPIEETQQWLQKAVIGLNLCPFAKAVHKKGQIRWVLSAATEPAALRTELVNELQHLVRTDAAVTDTTVLVHPRVLQNFDDFNQFLGVAEDTVAQLGLEGVLQIASFHPQYQFADTEPDDAGNCSNRAPYPTLHLLREASIERAVAAYPEAAAIYGRNIDTLQRLGFEGWRRLLEH